MPRGRGRVAPGKWRFWRKDDRRKCLSGLYLCCDARRRNRQGAHGPDEVEVAKQRMGEAEEQASAALQMMKESTINIQGRDSGTVRLAGHFMKLVRHKEKNGDCNLPPPSRAKKDLVHSKGQNPPSSRHGAGGDADGTLSPTKRMQGCDGTDTNRNSWQLMCMPEKK